MLTMIELKCKNLAVGYDGKAVATGIDFVVEKGDYLYIVGENGSGKSTLMKTILGLLKPVSGELVYGEGVRNSIGYIPQQTEAQKDFPASVYEIVLSGCQAECGFRPFYSAKQKQKVKDNMELFGITALAKRCSRELSGGQKQRVLLARALCAAKGVLLLDEPTAGLDPIVTNELYDVIDRLNKEQGMTIITVSHDISSALKYASHVLSVADKCFFGRADDFYKSEYFLRTVKGNVL